MIRRKLGLRVLLSIHLSIVAGCAKAPPTMTFKVVDATTGMPLPGVQCDRLSLPMYETDTPVTQRTYPPTTPDGLLTINDLPARHRTRLYISKPDYEQLQLTVGPQWDHVLFAPNSDTPTKEEGGVLFAEGRRVPLTTT